MKDAVRAMVVGLLVALPVAAALAGRFVFVNSDLVGGYPAITIFGAASVALPLLVALPLIAWGQQRVDCPPVVSALVLLALSLIYAVVAWRATGIRTDSDALWSIGVLWVAAQAVLVMCVVGSVTGAVLTAWAIRRMRRRLSRG